jgi:phosphatidylserine decarboxylase
MTMIQRMAEHLNFALTNLPPRRSWSRWMGYLSKIENRTLTRMALWVWNRFDPLELNDSPPNRYKSIHECFIRPLNPGARQVDATPEVLTSPCDGVVGAFGRVVAGQLFQIKGKIYRIDELIGAGHGEPGWLDGHFMTIRIKSNMYHRFHAPATGELRRVRYFSGDAYNVNPTTLRRVDRLFCKNERACLTYQLDTHETIALIPVAAIWVAGIRLHALSGQEWMNDGQVTQCEPGVPYAKGQEMGWFEHGSTIVILTPSQWRPSDGLSEGDRLWMGQALFQRDDQRS